MENRKVIDRKQESELLNILDLNVKSLERVERYHFTALIINHKKRIGSLTKKLEKLDPNKTDEGLQDLIKGYKQIAGVYY